MLRSKFAVGGVSLAVLTSVLLSARAADPKAPATKPAAPAVKLVKPWGDLTSLTDDQRTKIHDVHVKALAEINVIEKRETAEIEAMLTDAQKTELKDLKGSKKKGDAEKRGMKKTADKGEAPDRSEAPADKAK